MNCWPWSLPGLIRKKTFFIISSFNVMKWTGIYLQYLILLTRSFIWYLLREPKGILFVQYLNHTHTHILITTVYGSTWRERAQPVRQRKRTRVVLPALWSLEGSAANSPWYADLAWNLINLIVLYQINRKAAAALATKMLKGIKLQERERRREKCSTLRVCL